MTTQTRHASFQKNLSSRKSLATHAFNSTHYNEISSFLETVVGQHFHFGIYDSVDTSTEAAARQLSTFMAEQVRISPKDKLLDIGCGIGSTSALLSKIYDVQVTGISSSLIGIKRAIELHKNHKQKENLRFIHCDAADLSKSVGAFDIAYIQESSHLMSSKLALFSSVARVLEPQGRVVLCDFFLNSMTDIAERKTLSHIAHIMKAFGRLHVEPISSYRDAMVANDFCDVKHSDLTAKTLRTIDRWRSNANNMVLNTNFDKEFLPIFLKALDSLAFLFNEQVLSYGVLSSSKTPNINKQRPNND